MNNLKNSPLVLDAILGQRSKLTLLRYLYHNPSGMSGRALARRSGLSHQTALQSLDDLYHSGVVLKEKIPPAYRFTLNFKHWVVGDILKDVFKKEQEWITALTKDVVLQLPKFVRSIVLFGSRARGEMTLESDVDLLILYDGLINKENVEEYFLRKSLELLPVYRHKVSAVAFEITDFKKKYKEENRFVREIVNTGRVVWGKLLTEILFCDVAKANSATHSR